nr:hypothetical protein [Tanacetum cinerariifolium]
MGMTIDQQVALDEAIVPHASRLRIGKRNFRLKSDISSKESTFQLAKEIRRLTDVNINKLHQPWRSFTAIINKCLSGKSTGYDSLRLKIKMQRRTTRHTIPVTPLPIAAACTRLSTSVKGKQPAKASKAKSLTVLSEVAMIEAEQLKLATKRSLQQTHISQASGSGVDKGTGSDDQDDDDQDDENKDDEDQDEGDMMTIKRKGKRQDEEDDEDELYRDVNINLEGRVVQMADVYTTQEFEDSHVTLTSVNPDGQQQTKVAVQIQSDILCDEAQAENEEFLKNLDENIQKIIKEQVKEQLKKIKGNKSIHRFDEQRNLYKALVEAYKSDKIILDTYGDTITLKRRRDDDAEPTTGSDRGSKKRKEGKEPESRSAPKEKATRATGKST